MKTSTPDAGCDSIPEAWSPPTLLQELEVRRDNLIKSLTDTNEAINLVKANPGLEEYHKIIRKVV